MDCGLSVLLGALQNFMFFISLFILSSCVHLSWYLFIKTALLSEYADIYHVEWMCIDLWNGDVDLWFLHNVFLKSCTERLSVSWEKHRNCSMCLHVLTCMTYSKKSKAWITFLGEEESGLIHFWWLITALFW